MPRAPLIALRLTEDLDKRLNEAAGANKSAFVRSAIEEKLANGGAAPVKTKRAAGGKCEHGMRSGAYCKRCEGLVP